MLIEELKIGTKYQKGNSKFVYVYLGEDERGHNFKCLRSLLEFTMTEKDIEQMVKT